MSFLKRYIKITTRAVHASAPNIYMYYDTESHFILRHILFHIFSIILSTIESTRHYDEQIKSAFHWDLYHYIYSALLFSSILRI